jgi:branched-subunit amino acid transport protein
VRAQVWAVIVGMAIVTYLTRAPLLMILARQPLAPRLRLWLRMIPLAVLPALALPLVLVVRNADGTRVALGLGHPPLWGAIVVVVLASLRVNFLVTVAVAVATVAVLRALG